MHQLIYFKIKNNSTNNFVQLECRVELVDSISKPITYIVDKKKLGAILGSNFSSFVQKLVKNGEFVQKMRAPEGHHAETVLEKLKKEFGNKFTITVLPIKGRDLKQPKKESIGKSPKTIKRVTKVAKAPKKINKERYSNFLGEEENYVGLGSIETVSNKIAESSFVFETSYDTVEVLYATDRNRTDSTEPNETYGNIGNTSNILEYGICKISIPPEHEVGNIERPEWYQQLFFSDPENPKDHVVIYDLKIKAEPDFLNCLNTKIKSSTNKDAFIFIHGFNVSFQEAIRRTAQIAHDLSFKGASISYSWPSQSNVRGYMSDEDSVIWTVPHLKGLIKKVLGDSTLVKLHLIAHSMGNRALTNAIKELNAEGFNLDKINQIVLAAPDIDSKVFIDVIVPGIKGVSKQITLYASSKDKALIASRKIRSGIIRAGELGIDIVIVDGISTVDASKVDTNFLGHGYFAETKELIHDLYLILEHSFEPQQRNLRKKQKPPKGSYWLFPE